MFLYFLISLIKFFLWLNFFSSQEEGGGHGGRSSSLSWEGPMGSCSVTKGTGRSSNIESPGNKMHHLGAAETTLQAGQEWSSSCHLGEAALSPERAQIPTEDVSMSHRFPDNCQVGTKGNNCPWLRCGWDQCTECRCIIFNIDKVVLCFKLGLFSSNDPW